MHAPTMTTTPFGARQKQMTQENSNMNGDIAIMIRVKVGLTLFSDANIELILMF